MSLTQRLFHKTLVGIVLGASSLSPLEAFSSPFFEKPPVSKFLAKNGNIPFDTNELRFSQYPGFTNKKGEELQKRYDRVKYIHKNPEIAIMFLSEKEYNEFLQYSASLDKKIKNWYEEGKKYIETMPQDFKDALKKELEEKNLSHEKIQLFLSGKFHPPSISLEINGKTENQTNQTYGVKMDYDNLTLGDRLILYFDSKIIIKPLKPDE